MTPIALIITIVQVIGYSIDCFRFTLHVHTFNSIKILNDSLSRCINIVILKYDRNHDQKQTCEGEISTANRSVRTKTSEFKYYRLFVKYPRLITSVKCKTSWSQYLRVLSFDVPTWERVCNLPHEGEKKRRKSCLKCT